MRTPDLVNRVCEALGRPPNSLSLEDSPRTVPEWDSLGHLAIISMLDEDLGVPVDDDEMRDFKSVRELVDRLKARGAVED